MNESLRNKINRIAVFITLFIPLLIPFLVTWLIQGNIDELSKVVFSIYLIIPVTAIVTLKYKLKASAVATTSLLISIVENLDWRLLLSQKLNEVSGMVLNPQWILLIITTISIVLLIITLYKTKKLVILFAIFAVSASLISTYAFHFLIINKGIEYSIIDHYKNMKTIASEDERIQQAKCSILKLICIQEKREDIISTLRKHELDRESILSIHEYSNKNKVFYAWRETDLISSALNGNGILIGYIQKEDKSLIVIDKTEYTVVMQRQESLFMYLVILFHITWIPGWIYITLKHRRITLK